MNYVSALAALALSAFAVSASAASFTYRGHLEDGGKPAEGVYRLELRLFADAIGSQPLAAPVVVDQVPISAGRFAVGVDFRDVPAHAHSGWLEVAVMSEADGAFWPLPKKQPVALKAQICPESWALGGNDSTNPAANFLGTTDNRPLELRTRNVRSLRIEPSAELFEGLPITVNMIGGSHSNQVTSGVRGATTAGGGVPQGNSDPDFEFPGKAPNRVGDHYVTVGGGYANVAGTLDSVVTNAVFATVGGGRRNTAGGSFSTIIGGDFNQARGAWSTVGGGRQNCAGGDYSWAGGNRARVRPANASSFGVCTGLAPYPGGNGDQGTFVWADSTNANFVSTGSNQFLVRAGGGMGVGTNAPQCQLHVYTATDAPGAGFQFNPTLLVENENAADFFSQAIVARASGTIGVANPTFRLHLNQDSAFKPGSNTRTTSSDERLKTDIETLDGSLEKLLALRGVSYRWRDPEAVGGHDGVYTGLLAQNVEQVFPEWVGTDPAGYKTVTVTAFEGLVAEALRELRAEKDTVLAVLAKQDTEVRAEIMGIRDDIAMVQALLSPVIAEGAH